MYHEETYFSLCLKNDLLYEPVYYSQKFQSYRFRRTLLSSQSHFFKEFVYHFP